jgi:MYXO-CTERM domain-containing protein
MRRSPLAAGALVSALTMSAGTAHAFCRTMTCPTPAGYPSDELCYPPDFESLCASLNPPRKVLPVYWANACVTYDINQNASAQVPYATAAQEFAVAFSKWTGTICAAAGGEGGAEGRVSIDIRDLGPVTCDALTYNTNEGNQNVILFHDDFWPYNDANNTLGLTTITYDPDTGELDDADMEINATVPLSVGDPLAADGYDFESIITHETGHFFGMAHSTDDTATMFAHYTPGTSFMRILKADDMAGICSIYPPDGTRSVATSVAAGGAVMEDACNPEPKGGFQSACTVPLSTGCSATIAPRAEGSSQAPAAALLGLAALAGAAVRRRRRAGVRAAAVRMW